ncbi:MAG: transposase [Acidimicrobiales bacterium]
MRRDAWNRWRHRSRRLGKPFKDARFALARSRQALVADDSRTGERQRLALYDATNLDVPLSIAYELKEAFRAAMAIGKNGDVETFTAALELFDALCLGSGIEAFVTLAKTLRGWRAEIVNYAASGGASNGFAESLNHLIKNQKRQAHGYRTWAGFRGQILWAYGEAVDPDTGEVKPLRAVPRGLGANWIQPSFA